MSQHERLAKITEHDDSSITSGHLASTTTAQRAFDADRTWRAYESSKN